MTILTIGLACYDQFFFTNNYPRENTKGIAVDFIESGGGPASNAAYLLGLWGENVNYVGHLGKDIYSAKVINEMNDVGVNTSDVIFSDKMVTPLASIIVNTSTSSRTLLVRKSNKPPKITLGYKPNVVNYRAILIDGHEEELSYKIILANNKSPVVMDAGSLRESTLNLAKITDYLVASEHFALDYIGISEFKNNDQLVEAIIEIDKITRGHVVITLGEKGCVYIESKNLIKNTNKDTIGRTLIGRFKNRNIYHQSAYICKAIDSTGAGDIFHAAFTYGVSYKWELDKIINFSSKTAALSIEKLGVRGAIPSLNEVESCQFELNLNNYFKDKIC